nr:hypothetical protein [Trichocoleus desertorum]
MKILWINQSVVATQGANMEKRSLGNSDIQISPVLMGTWQR